MGFTSIWHWLIVLAVVLLLFGGRGKISALMGDFGRGLKNFKSGLKEEEQPEAASGARALDGDAVAQAEPAKNDQAVKS